MKRRQLILGAGLSVALAGCERFERRGTQASVDVQFGWLFDAHHAGFASALAHGHYENAGLKVRLLPGGLDTSPIRTTVTGASSVGQAGGLEQLVAAAHQGLPIRPLAAIHRQTPHALISLERSPIRRPADLRGKRIAVAFGDAAEVLLRALMANHHIAPDEVTLVPFRFDLTPLLRGDVDAITGFSTDQPATLKARGEAPVVLKYDENGIRSYGYTLFARNNLDDEQRRSLQAFLSASRQGWIDAFARPDDALRALQTTLNVEVDTAVEREKLAAVREIMLGADGTLPAWGIDAAVVRDVIGYLVAADQLPADMANDAIVRSLTPPPL